MSPPKETNENAAHDNNELGRWTRFKLWLEAQLFPGPERFTRPLPEELREHEVDGPRQAKPTNRKDNDPHEEQVRQGSAARRGARPAL